MSSSVPITEPVVDAVDAAAGQRPQVLYLVHRVPYPPNRGDRIRSFHLLKCLAARADVHLAFLCEEPPPQSTLEALEPVCRKVLAVPQNRYARYARAFASLATGATATEGLFRSPRLWQGVARWALETRFDAVVVFCSSMVQYLDVPGLRDVPAVVDLVDVDSQKWFDYAATSRGPKRMLFALEGRRLRRLECSLPGRASAVTLVSEREAELFRAFCPAHCVHAVPNGVDLEYFRPAPLDREMPSAGCVFVGALDYRANIDGLEWFCRAVWPEIRRRRPEATFTIVGSRPGPAVARLTQLAGVELASDVPDVRPYLAAAAVVVAPLRVARGIQNKVLEALAMGRAVVATPQALEGLAVTPGTECLSAAAPAAFAVAVAGLLQAPAERAALGRAGRDFVERRHSWPAQYARFASLPGLPPALAARPAARKTAGIECIFA